MAGAETRTNGHLTSPGTIGLLVAPAVIASTIFFVIPMATIAFRSLSDVSGAVSIGNYVGVLTDLYYWEILSRTVRVSAFATLAALIVSYPAALVVFYSESRWRGYFLLIAVSPLFISVVVRSYGWIVVLSPNGALNGLFGLETSFRLLGTETAIVVGLTHIFVPFMLLSLNASLSKIDKRLLSAAASLGASQLRAFKDVVLPLSVPGILSGSIIVFTMSLTAFTTPILLGGTLSKTLPYLIYQQVMLLSNWPLGSTLALVLLATAVILVFAMTRLARKYMGSPVE